MIFHKYLGDSKMFEYDKHYQECRQQNKPFIKAKINPVHGNYYINVDLMTCNYVLTKKEQDEIEKLKEAAAMFTPVLQSQAKKRIPMINEVKEKVKQSLLNTIPAQSLEQNLEILVKALECYKADIEKAEDTGIEYFVKLFGDVHEARNDLESIKNALIKIKQHSE